MISIPGVDGTITIVTQEHGRHVKQVIDLAEYDQMRDPGARLVMIVRQSRQVLSNPTHSHRTGEINDHSANPTD